MESIYDKALEEDEKMFARLEQLPQADIEALTKIPDFSDFTLKNQDLFKFTINEEEASYRLKIFDTEIPTLLNKAGIVRIGNQIFQYNEDNRKIILDGDDEKISLLFDITKTNEDSYILFQKVKVKTVSFNNEANARTTAPVECNDTNGSYRVLGNITAVGYEPDWAYYYDFDPIDPSNKTKVYYIQPGRTSVTAKAKTQKHSWGKWRNHTTGYNRISGTITVWDGDSVIPAQTVTLNVNANGSISTKELIHVAYQRSIYDFNPIYLSIGSTSGITFKGKNNTECKKIF